MKKSLLKDIVFGALNEQSGPCTSGCCNFQSLKVNCPNGNPPGCGGSNAAYGGQPSRCNFIDGNPPVVGDEFIIPGSGALANCLYKVVSVHENGPKPLNKNYISGVCPPPPPPSGCTDPLANNYDPLAIIDDGSCIYGCLSGDFPPFGFQNSCSSTVYNSWPLTYTAPIITQGGFGISPTFTWTGSTFLNPITNNTVNNGDSVGTAFMNLVLPNQGSYCEWCADFANPNPNYGGAGVSPQMNTWFPIWGLPNLTDEHCCCCPSQGGSYTGTSVALPLMQGPINPNLPKKSKDSMKSECDQLDQYVQMNYNNWPTGPLDVIHFCEKCMDGSITDTKCKCCKDLNLQEGIQIKGTLLNLNRMKKLANILKKK